MSDKRYWAERALKAEVLANALAQINADLRAQLAKTQDLLRRAWEFPDRPTPEEDEMRTHAEFAAEQEAWRAKREAMDAAVKRALAEPEAEENGDG